jgi:GNAT superfamily N-acetyltransferase
MKIREARPEDAKQIARVMVDTWRTTYRGIVADSFLQSMCYVQRETRWLELLRGTDGMRFTYVADDVNGSIVGYISGGRERTGDRDFSGELYAIYIDPSYQGRGLGRLLVAALAERLLSAGLSEMLVWVIAANSSRHFYERLGGRYLRAQPFDIGDESIETVAYGWTDLHMLQKKNHCPGGNGCSR